MYYEGQKDSKKLKVAYGLEKKMSHKTYEKAKEVGEWLRKCM